MKKLHHRTSRFGTLSLACPRSHNDMNVMQRSSLFARLTEGQAPLCNYTVNGHKYHMLRYYLVDGIYPPWETFIKIISESFGQKRAHFAQRQGARKDVECSKHVLQLFMDLLNNGIR